MTLVPPVPTFMHGGLLSVLARQGCSVFQGIIFAPFSDIERKNFFQRVGVKICRKGIILLDQVVDESNSYYLDYIFTDVFLESAIVGTESIENILG